MKKKVFITCAVVLGVILAVYLGFAFYFSSHYLFNTKINSVKYAGKKPECFYMACQSLQSSKLYSKGFVQI